jgi:hypothetical protein
MLISQSIKKPNNIRKAFSKFRLSVNFIFIIIAGDATQRGHGGGDQRCLTLLQGQGKVPGYLDCDPYWACTEIGERMKARIKIRTEAWRLPIFSEGRRLFL